MPDITFGLLRGAVGDDSALMTRSVMSVQLSEENNSLLAYFKGSIIDPSYQTSYHSCTFEMIKVQPSNSSWCKLLWIFFDTHINSMARFSRVTDCNLQWYPSGKKPWLTRSIQMRPHEVRGHPTAIQFWFWLICAMTLNNSDASWVNFRYLFWQHESSWVTV